MRRCYQPQSMPNANVFRPEHIEAVPTASFIQSEITTNKRGSVLHSTRAFYRQGETVQHLRQNANLDSFLGVLNALTPLVTR